MRDAAAYVRRARPKIGLCRSAAFARRIGVPVGQVTPVRAWPALASGSDQHD
jgi:hypothetical protein